MLKMAVTHFTGIQNFVRFERFLINILVTGLK